jgi:bacterioferritin-associated ferredoxin
MSDAPTRPNLPSYVCRCEEIGEAAIRAAISEGAQSVNDVKRRTRAGMGICQGIYCVRPIAELLARYGGAPLDQIEPMTARPPVRPLPLALLADLAIEE